MTFKAMGHGEFTPVAVECLCKQSEGEFQVLLAPPFAHLFLSLLKELSGLFGDVVAFTAEARGREKETSPVHSPS